MTGDHKPTAQAIKKRNKAERAGQISLTLFETPADVDRWAAQRAQALTALPDDTAAQVHAKADAYAAYVNSPEYQWKKLEYDVWTAAFFWRMSPGERALEAPTHGELLKVRQGQPHSQMLESEVRALAEKLRFFHWELAFPEVFSEQSSVISASPTDHRSLITVHSGFDCILGNPPWERIKLQEEEFFAARDPRIAAAANKAARQKAIDALAKSNPALAEEFTAAKHAAECVSKFVRASGRFPLTAVGDVNTYALFAELSRELIAAQGRAGIIVPTGIATDDTTKDFFADLTEKQTLASLFDFENRAGLFPAVDSRMRFCALTISGLSIKQSEFVFFATQVDHVRDMKRRFRLVPQDVALFNPNTRTMPLFRTRADAELTRKIYQRVPVLDDERENPKGWGVYYMRLIDLSDHSEQLRFVWQEKPADYEVPLYEAKLTDIYDHRYATFADCSVEKISNGQPREVTLKEKNDPLFSVLPRYYLPTVLKQTLFEKYPDYAYSWLLVWRDVARSTDERTCIPTIIPKTLASRKLPALGFLRAPFAITLYANIASLVFDYIARQKVPNISLSFYILKQLPVLPPAHYSPADISYIVPRVVELTYTAYDLQPFAQDILNEVGVETWNGWFPLSPLSPLPLGEGDSPKPFRWDEARRAQLRAELDAYYARLYGLTRDELRYILDPKDVHGPDFPGETFRVLKEKEEKAYGEFRTRRLVLEAWDKMGE